MSLLRQSAFSRCADAPVDQLVMVRAKHPEHVALVLRHVAPRAVATKVWLVGGFEDPPFVAAYRLADAWQGEVSLVEPHDDRVFNPAPVVSGLDARVAIEEVGRGPSTANPCALPATIARVRASATQREGRAALPAVARLRAGIASAALDECAATAGIRAIALAASQHSELVGAVSAALEGDVTPHAAMSAESQGRLYLGHDPILPLNAAPIWVRPVAVALSVDHREAFQ